MCRFVVVLRHGNIISLISWWWYDVWDEKEKARADSFNNSGNFNLSHHIGMVWEELAFDEMNWSTTKCYRSDRSLSPCWPIPRSNQLSYLPPPGMDMCRFKATQAFGLWKMHAGIGLCNSKTIQIMGQNSSREFSTNPGETPPHITHFDTSIGPVHIHSVTQFPDSEYFMIYSIHIWFQSKMSLGNRTNTLLPLNIHSSFHVIICLTTL